MGWRRAKGSMVKSSKEFGYEFTFAEAELRGTEGFQFTVTCLTIDPVPM